jgi:putative acetyltransferase
MNIREINIEDLSKILLVQRAAFNRDKEANITQLLLQDISAQPLLSLIAEIDGQPIGHILFTKGQLTNHQEIAVSFLAPLAVIPKFQRDGIGSELIKKGFEVQAKSGISLIFVVGHPTYYPRFGFKPAAKFCFEPTYPIPIEHADAWMVYAMKPNILGKVYGRVICCDALNKPELWRE